MTPMKVLVVGRGKVGSGLQRAARSRGSTLACRMRSLAGLEPKDVAWAETILLAVPDQAIRSCAERLAAEVGALPVLHLSGNRATDEASACREHGALHPLASFASKDAPPDLRGVSFALGGTPAATRAGRRLVRALGGRVLSGPARHGPLQGPAYHAAAALVANGAAALSASGVDILMRLGVERRAAQRAVAALLRTVAQNVEQVGVPAALTGPIMRGDAATVKEHRRALTQLGGESRATYDAVAHAILACARAAGLSARGGESVRDALAEPLRRGASKPRR